MAVTSDGYSLRFGFEAFVEPSTRAGRRYARPSEGVEVVGVAKIDGSEIIIAATAAGAGHAVQGGRDQLPVGARQGRHPHQAEARRRTACSASSPRRGDRDLLTVETSRGAEQTISTTKYEVTGRGGKGRELLQRGQFTRIVSQDLAAPPSLEGPAS